MVVKIENKYASYATYAEYLREVLRPSSFAHGDPVLFESAKLFKKNHLGLVGDYRFLLIVSKMFMDHAAGKELRADQMDIQTSECVGDFLFDKMRRPTWTISPDVLWLLESVKCEMNMEDIVIPRDVLLFRFPYGYHVRGIPCRNVLFLYPRSELTVRMLCELMGSEYDSKDYTSSSLRILTRFGEKPDGTYDWGQSDCPLAQLVLRVEPGTSVDEALELARAHGVKDRAVCEDLRDEEYDAFHDIMKLCVACMMYVRAEPEAAQDRRTARSGRRVKMRPNERYIAPVRSLPRMIVQDGERAVAHAGDSRRSPVPHLRGWVLRTLRHERYKRNEDGSCRTVLVAPTLVGTKDHADTESAPQDLSVVRYRTWRH